MDNSRLNMFLSNIKAFLLSKLSREAVIFLVFVLLSAGFWLLLALNESNELEMEYELTLTDIPEGTIITSELPSPIHVVVRDKGTTLVRYLSPFRHNVLSVAFEVNNSTATSGHVVLTYSELQKMLQPSLDASTRIVTIRPDTLEYFFNRGARKRVPVRFMGHVETDELSFLSDMYLQPDSVTVWADKEYLDSLTAMYTVSTTLSELAQTTERQLQLAVPKGVKCEPAEVKLTAEVDVYTEKSVDVPIVGTNFPGGYTLRTFPTYAKVTFRVGSRDYKKITAEDFVLTATYEDLLASTDSVMHLELRSAPEGVSQVRIQPETVQFLIEQTEE